MQKHLSLLGLLYLVMGAFGLLGALIVFLALAIPGMFAGDARTFLFTSSLGLVIGLFLVVVSLPSVIAGIGVMARKRWSRTVTLIVAVFQLFNFPFGTALGIYSFWVLTKAEAVALLEPRAY